MVCPPSPKVEEKYFSKRSFSWVMEANIFGQIWRKEIVLHEVANDQILAKWGVGA